MTESPRQVESRPTLRRRASCARRSCHWRPADCYARGRQVIRSLNRPKCVEAVIDGAFMPHGVHQDEITPLTTRSQRLNIRYLQHSFFCLSGPQKQHKNNGRQSSLKFNPTMRVALTSSANFPYLNSLDVLRSAKEDSGIYSGGETRS